MIQYKARSKGDDDDANVSTPGGVGADFPHNTIIK